MSEIRGIAWGKRKITLVLYQMRELRDEDMRWRLMNRWNTQDCIWIRRWTCGGLLTNSELLPLKMLSFLSIIKIWQIVK